MKNISGLTWKNKKNCGKRVFVYKFSSDFFFIFLYENTSFSCFSCFPTKLSRPHGRGGGRRHELNPECSRGAFGN